jgi:hypothetical protein
MQKQGKLLSAAAAITCGTVLIVGVVLGTRPQRRSSNTSNLKGTAVQASGAVTANCGTLQMYNSGSSNTLDGTLKDFAYGPELQSCCTAEYACPWAAVATYSCPNGSITYEATCCTAEPISNNYSSCQGGDVYQANVGAATSRRLAVGAGCTLTGFAKLSTINITASITASYAANLRNNYV